MKDRLSTRDRIRSWGNDQACLLCGELDETRDHLVFACSYSFTILLDISGDILGVAADPD